MNPSKTTRTQSVQTNSPQQGSRKMRIFTAKYRKMLVACAIVLAIIGAAVSSLVVRRAGAAPVVSSNTVAPASNAGGKFVSALARFNGATPYSLAAQPRPFTFGVCDTAGPIEVESTAGTAAGVPTAYADLASAFAAINGGVIHLGSVTIDVCGNTTEAGTATLNQVAGVTSVSISPAGGAARTITGNLALPLIDINGADNVTINGLNTGGNSLTLSNTSISGTAGTSTIRFINDATSNFLQNATVSGSAIGASTGTIIFAGTTGTTGNDNNTVTGCNIGPAGAAFPANGIFANGSTTTQATRNSGVQITNNNIFDFFTNTAVIADGIVAGGVTDWTITGNSFYQTASRTMSVAASGFIGISIADTSGINFNVSNNFVGGNAPSAGGTAWTQTGAVTHTFIGIRMSVGSATVSSLQGNTVANISVSTSTTSAINAGIAAVTGAMNIGTTTGNTIGATTGTGSITWTGAGTGAQFAGILAGTGTPNGINISNNNIGSITVAGAGTTTLLGIRAQGAATGGYTISGNTIGSTTTANSISSNANIGLVGISSTQTVFPATITNNTVANIQHTSTGTAASLRGIETTGGINGHVMSNNTIRDLTTTSTSTNASATPAIAAIFANGTANARLISGNTIFNLSSTTSGATAVNVLGILTGSSGSSGTMNANNIYNLSTASTSTTSAIKGIYLFNIAGTAPWNMTNNVIRLGTGLAPTINPIIRGINEDTGTTATNNIWNNSIYIGGVQGGNTVNTACVFRAVAGILDIRNNILWNNRASTGAPGAHLGRHYAIESNVATGTLTTNFNNLFADQNGGTVGFLTSDRITIADWRGAGAGFDTNSFSTDPLFVDPTNATTPNLHLQASNPESQGAQPLAAVTTDFDGQARPQPAATNPDIGADEGAFTVSSDLQPPAISYTALANTSSTGDRVLNVTVVDNVGVPTAGIGLPVIYYRKNAGSYFSSQCSFVSGSSYSCPIVAASLGGVALTDVIGYYVAAQDTSGLVSVFPAAGAAGLTANPPAAATPPTTPSSYTIVNAVTGNFTVPGSFPSLTNAGGMFEFINNNEVTGDVTIQISADLTGETGTVALNQFASPFTVTVRPTGAPRIITGNGTGLSVIRLNGADRFTIDGSLTVGGTTRDLTIINPNTATSGAIFIGSIGAGAGATDNTVRNCIIQAGGIGTTANFTFGFFVGLNTGAANGPDNDNLTIRNNVISKARTGIQSVGDPAGFNDNTQIIDNVIGDDVIGVSIGRQGINIGSTNNATIRGNTIKNIFLGAVDTATPFGMVTGPLTNSLITQNTINTVRSTGTTGNVSPYGIVLAAGTASTSVTRNVITNIQYTATSGFGGKGIEVNTGLAASDITIANNFVSNITGDGWNSTFVQDMICGMRVLGATGGVKFYNNSVNLGTGTFVGNASGLTTAALYVPVTAVGIDVRNNILSNNLDNTAVATDKNYAFFSDAASSAYTDINYNDYWVPVSSATGPQVLGFLASDRLLLTDIQAATGKDANSISADPLFVSATNLHLGAGSPAIGVGQTIAAVTDDIDGDGRPGNLAAEIGADEIADGNAPDTTINSNPTNPTASNAATFTFSGTDTVAPEVVASFECQLDGAGFAPCTSPTNFIGLADGSHTFQVRAKDFNGNVDPTPASFTWLVDTTAPNTTILTNPTDPSTSADATFTFLGTDSGGSGIAGFECKLDAGAFTACTSPQTYLGLSAGSHTFMVRAIDNVANADLSPASYTWTINLGPVGPVSVTATAGTTGPVDYPTVKAAFDAINAGTHQGAITVSIVTSTVEGATPATLNSSGAGPALYTSVLVRPVNDGVSVAGNPVTGFGVIQLNGADNVTIDGDNPNTAGINRNLTVSNTAPAATTANSVIRIATSAAVTSADNNTIKNCALLGNVTAGNAVAITAVGSSSNLSFGVYAGGNGGATAIGAPTALNSITANTAPTGTTINNLLIDNNTVNQTARGIVFNGAVATVSNGVTISNNVVGDQGAVTPPPPFTTPSTTVYSKGIWVAGTSAVTVNGNTLKNIFSFVSSTITSIETAAPVTATTITNNTATNVANNGTANIVKAILVASNTGAYTIAGNSVSNVQSFASASGTDAIEVTAAATGGTIERNKIDTVIGRSAGTFGAWGLNLTAGTGIVIRNNFISNISMDMTGGSAFSSQFSVHGIRITGGTNHKIYHNSVYLFGTLLGTPTTAIMTSCLTVTATTITGLDVRNNIFNNQLTGGTTSIAHVSIFLPINAASAMNLTLNNNDYFSGPDAARQGIAQANTTAGTGFYLAANFNPATTTPATNLRALTTLLGPATNDNASQVVDPQFLSTTDLHIAPASPMVNAGAAVGVPKDIDGQTRVPPPDIGADEPGGITPPANDIAATAIITPAPGGSVGAGSTATPQASFTNVGSATQTNVGVRFTITGPGGYSYVDNQVIASIAADQTITVNFAVTPPFASPGAYVTTALVTTADANAGNDSVTSGFTALAPVSGTVTVGTGGDFTSLTNPGGVFDAINGAGATSNITINVINDLTAETGTVALNQIAGGFTVLIQPSGGAARTISGSNGTGLINLNGADGVTINGLNAGGNSFLIRNTGTGATIRLLADASNNTIQNCTIEGASTTAVVLVATGTTTGNDNVAITGNTIRDRSDAAGVPANLITSGGTSAVIANSGLNISGNTLFNFTGNGVNIAAGTENLTISNNDISQSANRATAIIGINVSTSLGTNTITQNSIHDLRSSVLGGTFVSTVGLFVLDARNLTVSRNRIYNFAAVAGGTGRIVGIEFEGASGTAAAATIVNNMVSMVTSVPTANPVFGIFDFAFGGNTVTIDHNSIYLGGVASGAANSWALVRGTAAPTTFTARNNIAFNNRTGGTGSHFAGGDQSGGTGTFVSNFNFFAGTAAGTPANFMDYSPSSGAGTPISFATWQTGPPARDANSIAGVASSFNANNFFVNQDAGDLHLKATATPVLDAGTPLATVTTDFDNDPRSATTPDIGADELVAVALTADLAITKTDGVTTAVPGGSVTYTITASNAGPSAATGATVADTFPAAINPGAMWTCVGAGGGICTAAGSGNINDTVNLPAGGSVTYTVTATIAAGATGSLVNMANVTVPMGVMDPNTGNNSATDTDTLTPQADLAITKTDGVTTVSQGGTTTYTITASNSGPSNAPGANVADTFPAGITSANWSCMGSGGGTCTLSGSGSINDTVNLPAGGSVTYTVIANISGSATGSLSNTATVTAPGGVTDGNTGNNSATDTDTISILPVLTINDARLTEGDEGTTNMTFTVTLSSSSANASVHYHTSNGTATAGSPPAPSLTPHGNDYVPEQDGIIFFGNTVSPEGSSQTRTFNIQINGDTFKEPNEFFTVVLDQPSGATISRSTGYGVIVDEDRAYLGDFDRDRKTDLSVFRPSQGSWYTLQSSNGFAAGFNFGLSVDRPVPGDYDGDGRVDFAVRRPGATNQWWYLSSSDLGLNLANWGIDSDKSVQADYDGDDKTDVAVFRDGAWYILQSSTMTLSAVSWGTTGDLPVPGDFDGDGKADYCVFRAGNWYLLRSSDNGTATQSFGLAGDVPLGGDFDGDGRFDFAVVRGGTTWHILNSLLNNLTSVNWGQSGDIPVVGDYDGDGTSDIGVFRPSEGNWYVLRSSNGSLLATHWGLNGDIPVPAGYQP
jgi:hypothetical protein